MGRRIALSVGFLFTLFWVALHGAGEAHALTENDFTEAMSATNIQFAAEQNALGFNLSVLNGDPFLSDIGPFPGFDPADRRNDFFIADGFVGSFSATFMTVIPEPLPLAMVLLGTASLLVLRRSQRP